MHRILTLALLAAIVCSCGRDTDNTLSDMNLKGKVKSMRSISYIAQEKFGKVEKAGLSGGENSRTSFNADGYITEVVSFDQNGQTLGKLVYEYDDRNRQTGGVTYTSDGETVSKTVFAYEGDDLVSISVYAANDTLANKTIVTNEDNNPVKYEVYDGNDRLIAIRSLKYDTDGHVLEERFRNVAEGADESKVVYTRQGNLVTSRVESRGDASVRFDYEYDTQNNPVKMFFSDGNGGDDVLFVEYQYDEKGNWISQTMLRSQTRIPIEIVEREYEYYR